MLDQNAEWMPPDPLRLQVEALNNPDDPAPLGKIWEVAVLNALSKIVRITHEPDFGSKPDIVFEVGGETVVADVTTISDKSCHHANPVDELTDAFFRRVLPLERAGLKGGFSLSIGEKNPRSRGKDQSAPILRLPPLHRFKAVIFTPAFRQFIESLKRSPDQSQTYRVDTPECDLTLTFNPNSSGWTLMSVRYNQTRFRKSNPLWHALDQKRRQLAKIPITAHRGIIVCDGDCAAIKTVGDWDEYGTHEIIKEFLRAHNSIEFVLTLIPTHRGRNLDLNARNHELVANLYPERTNVPLWLAPIKAFPSILPQVQNTAANSRYRSEWKKENRKWNESPSFRGASTVSRARIKLSARDLLELLARVLRQDAFEALPFMARGNPFVNKLMGGQLITAIRIEKDETGADDDWAVIEFGDPDPAVSPFRLSSSVRQKADTSKSSG
jgi:hypothetical protein